MQHYEGKADGTKTFDAFQIKRGDHLVWKTTTKRSANLFIADLYKEGQSSGNDLPYLMITSIANGESQGDTVTIQQDDASVYLSVTSDSTAWSVDVQRYQ